MRMYSPNCWQQKHAGATDAFSAIGLGRSNDINNCSFVHFFTFKQLFLHFAFLCCRKSMSQCSTVRISLAVFHSKVVWHLFPNAAGLVAAAIFFSQ